MKYENAMLTWVALVILIVFAVAVFSTTQDRTTVITNPANFNYTGPAAPPTAVCQRQPGYFNAQGLWVCHDRPTFKFPTKMNCHGK